MQRIRMVHSLFFCQAECCKPAQRNFAQEILFMASGILLFLFTTVSVLNSLVCLVLEPGVTRWKAQTNPLSYGSTPDIFCYLPGVSKSSLPIDLPLLH